MTDQVFVGRPADQRPAEQLLWDALEILIPATVLNYQRLLASLAAHAASSDDDQHAVVRTAILTDVLGMVGNLERLRKLTAKLGGSPDVRVARKAFAATVSKYEQARHHIEHLDRAVELLADEPVAALAMITWWERTADGRAARLLIPGRDPGQHDGRRTRPG